MSEVLVIGGGHNGLVAACYLAEAGISVRVIEARDELGGATASKEVFPGIKAKLSRYSYLVSLLPDQIIKELQLDFQTLGREISSFTPTRDDRGLLISRSWNEATAQSFRSVGAASDIEDWQKFYAEVAGAAPVIADTFLKPLPTRDQLKGALEASAYQLFFEEPLGKTLRDRFDHDLVRGVVMTDGLIGTFTDVFDRELLANRCFLYHLVGNGTGEWRVPRGGMGALVEQLRARALSLGVEISLKERAISIEKVDGGAGFAVATTRGDGTRDQLRVAMIAAAISPQELARLQGHSYKKKCAPGSQVKINMVLKKLPRLRSGISPEDAFAGTFHFDEGMDEMQRAFEEAAAGELPNQIPAEIYCHTLSDPSILDEQLRDQGFQTLTLFALHTPHQLFRGDNEGMKEVAKEKLITQLDRYLIDPIEECLAIDSNGQLCIEVKSPVDLEEDLGLPQGNIFHSDLEFPIREESESLRWGSETGVEGIYLAGAGARRGGGVSGVGGHNAAMAILEKLGKL